MKRYLSLIGLIAVMGAGCSGSSTTPETPVNVNAPAGSAQQPSSAPAAQTAPAMATVTMDENGFSPDAIHVAKGGTVTFKNTGSVEVWPASDFHPTHLLYPKFDPKQGIKAGETYSIDFPDAKTYTYHDHLNPSHHGKVIVE